jgi:hypothetical protein
MTRKGTGSIHTWLENQDIRFDESSGFDVNSAEAILYISSTLNLVSTYYRREIP